MLISCTGTRVADRASVAGDGVRAGLATVARLSESIAKTRALVKVSAGGVNAQAGPPTPGESAGRRAGRPLYYLTADLRPAVFPGLLPEGQKVVLFDKGQTAEKPSVATVEADHPIRVSRR